MLSRFPCAHSNGRPPVGLAFYTQLMLGSLSRRVDVVVLAEKCDESKAPGQDGENPQVVRMWTEGPFGLLAVLLSWSRHRDRPDVFHMQHEFLGYGHIAANFFLMLILASSRMRRIPTIITLHGLFTRRNVRTLRLSEYGFALTPAVLFSVSRLWVRIVAAMSTRIVVNEQWQLEALATEYGVERPKLIHIPLGIPHAEQNNPKRLSTRDGRLRILFFGYLAPYKGIEKLLRAAGRIENLDFEVLIAGGPSPRAEGKPGYSRYLSALENLASSLQGRALMLGFVPEDGLRELFQSVDLVVLPYTSVLASSGPLALAVAYRTPVLTTAELLEECPACVFDGSEEDLYRKLVRFLEDPAERARALIQTERLLTERSWERVAALHEALYQEVSG